jgi:metallo-beta-lactamase family protein
MNEFAGLIHDKLGIETIIPNRGDSYLVSTKGVFEAEKRETAPLQETQQYSYMRLDVLGLLDKIRDELDEASSMVRNDLKNEKTDIEVEELKARLQKFEKYIVDIIK